MYRNAALNFFPGTGSPRPFMVTLRSCFRNYYLFTADVKYYWHKWSVKEMFLLYQAKIWVFHVCLCLLKWCRDRVNIRSTSTPFVQFCVSLVCVTAAVFIQLFPSNSSVSVLVESIDKLKKRKKGSIKFMWDACSACCESITDECCHNLSCFDMPVGFVTDLIIITHCK
jgi:hypothetical protein